MKKKISEKNKQLLKEVKEKKRRRRKLQIK